MVNCIDGSARTWYYDNGTITSQNWYRNGHHRREGDLPAEIWYYINGAIKLQYRDGRRHREWDLPAWIDYHDTGTIKSQCWFHDGLLHREEMDIDLL